MGLLEAYSTCIKKYAVFEGRARRSEYWNFFLFNYIISMLISIPAYYGLFHSASVVTGLYILSLVYSLFIFLPNLAVTVRRLHDTGHSGAHFFLILIPLIGSVILLIYFCRDSDPGENQYGPNPKDEGYIPVRSSYAPPRELPNVTVYAPTVGYPMTDVQTPQLPEAKKLRISFKNGESNGAYAEGKSLCIGRDAHQCQLTIPNIPGVSRTHCMVRTDGKRIEVRDLHSSYGTFLADGTRLDPNKPVVVQSGTRIYLGSKHAVVSVKLV